MSRLTSSKLLGAKTEFDSEFSFDTTEGRTLILAGCLPPAGAAESGFWRRLEQAESMIR